MLAGAPLLEDAGLSAPDAPALVDEVSVSSLPFGSLNISSSVLGGVAVGWGAAVVLALLAIGGSTGASGLTQAIHLPRGLTFTPFDWKGAKIH